MTQNTDLRQEPFIGSHERIYAATGSGDRVASLTRANDGLFRENPHLSENAKRTLQMLIGPDWLKYLKLADKIENGDADQSNDEQETLYVGFPAIVDTAIDLFNMVSRRDERIAELEREVQAYVEAEAGASL